ncbi:uncharacterized protein LOC131901285 [Peromyscus eremicus]|uniref:uncharacterized protein LOC131901285 n=1 Tax=Peromyscus eremicus TaxID=42410 RepID=UPI0027DD04DD|nr:uncharacterized protein LOC131901285 [Peromyscus eremicus]
MLPVLGPLESLERAESCVCLGPATGTWTACLFRRGRACPWPLVVPALDGVGHIHLNAHHFQDQGFGTLMLPVLGPLESVERAESCVCLGPATGTWTACLFRRGRACPWPLVVPALDGGGHIHLNAHHFQDQGFGTLMLPVLGPLESVERAESCVCLGPATGTWTAGLFRRGRACPWPLVVPAVDGVGHIHLNAHHFQDQGFGRQRENTCRP